MSAEEKKTIERTIKLGITVLLINCLASFIAFIATILTL